MDKTAETQVLIPLLHFSISCYTILHCPTFRTGIFSKCFCIIADFAVVTACNLLIHNLIAGNEIESILNATSFRYGACSLYIILSAIFALITVNIKKQEFYFPVPALISLMLLVIIGTLAMTTLMITINCIETLFSDAGTRLISPLYYVWFSFWAIWILLFSLLMFLGILHKKNLSLMKENELQRLEEAQYKSLQFFLSKNWKHKRRTLILHISYIFLKPRKYL